MSPGRAEQRQRATVARSKGGRIFCGIYTAEQQKGITNVSSRYGVHAGPPELPRARGRRGISGPGPTASLQIRHLFCMDKRQHRHSAFCRPVMLQEPLCKKLAYGPAGPGRHEYKRYVTAHASRFDQITDFILKKTHVAAMRFSVFVRKFSNSAVWEAGRKAREAARALAALPNEDRNTALERVAAALESGKVGLFCYFFQLQINIDIHCRTPSKPQTSWIVRQHRNPLPK